MNKEIKDFIKFSKGKIEIPIIVKYLEKFGYSVVFFDSETEVFQICGENVNGRKAIAVCGATKNVFVDNSLHTFDKTYVLLHELGHIALKHIGNNEIGMRNRSELENEAEAFVYGIMHYKRNKSNIIPYILPSVIVALSGILGYKSFKKQVTAWVH